MSPSQTRTAIDNHITRRNELALPKTLSGSLVGRIEHNAQGAGQHIRIVLESDVVLVTAGGAASAGGGVELLNFGKVRFQPVASRIYGSFVATIGTTAGEVGLGTVVATGAVAVLGGTATFENISEGGVPALPNLTANTAATAKNADGLRTEVGSTDFSTDTKVFLNAASAFAGAGTLSIKKGAVIEIWGIVIPSA